MRHSRLPRTRPGSAGFSMVELMVTLTILSVVGVVLALVMLSASRSKRATSNSIESSQAARAGLDLIARDLRSAGYGADLDYATDPQPPIAYIDSMQVLINANLSPYPDTSAIRQPPHAYNPIGTPRPHPLNGTSWQPPVKYGTGAEVIRWTLDLDNDGDVDADDTATALGVDAQATPNPDDFMLIRQVYGDSTAGVPLFNGGAAERVALVRKPGGGVEPLFTVYMKGASVPWDWASGPVPAAQLEDIERIIVNMTAPSSRPDWRGQFSESHLRTEINTMRNTPSNDFKEFAINGFVWNDTDEDRVKDGGESGIPGTKVLLDGYLTTTTDANGFYQFKVPAGTYLIKHQPAAGFGSFSDPDSYLVSVGPAVTRSFADTAASGGWIRAIVFHDDDHDGNKDGDEFFASGIPVYINGDTSTVVHTDVNGEAMIFAPAGTYYVYAALPDSFTTSVSLPITGTIKQGDTKDAKIGIYLDSFGTIEGTVFEDDDRDGNLDSTEPGIGNVWVAAVRQDGSTAAFAYSDDKGKYTIQAPVNDPPGTAETAYNITLIPPPGYAHNPMIYNVFVKKNEVLTGQDLGLGSFIIVTADADRVLSVGSGDLIENDWATGVPAFARADDDIILGAEASGKDNVMVWFNQYEETPLFEKNPTYTRDAPQSVLSIAVDTLDANPNKKRLDLVTGTRYHAAGNFFVWFTQNSPGNEGYLPPTYTEGRAYKTGDNGDVQVVLTGDVAGGPAPDIFAATRSPAAGQGVMEIWRSDDALTPSYTRDSAYPPSGKIPSNNLGEVNAVRTADFDKDGLMDLAVGTRTGTYSGQVMVFEFRGKGQTDKIEYQAGYDVPNDVITALAVLDVDGDGWADIVTGTQNSINSGKLQFWRNDTTGTISFTLAAEVNAPGIVTALGSGDFGGISRDDLVVGYQLDEGGYDGGIQLWYTDTGMPNSGVDPSGGRVKNLVTSITSGDYNYGLYPVEPFPPYLLDFAVGVKISKTQGELVIFIR